MELIDYDSTSSNVFSPVCRRCHGSGVLDWIDNLKGQKDPVEFDFKLESVFGHDSFLSEPLSTEVKEMVDKASKQLADKIDKDIIDAITYQTSILDSLGR